jgi:hypothetical protein
LRKAPFRCSILGLGYIPTKVSLGWKALPVTSTLAYFENSQITAEKSFIGLLPAPRRRSGGATRSKRKPPPQANAQNPGKQRIVIMTLFHTATAKLQSLCRAKVKMTVRLNGECHYINALWFKVIRTPVSPQLV